MWASGLLKRAVALWGCTEASRKYTAPIFKVDGGNFGAHKRLRGIISQVTTRWSIIAMKTSNIIIRSSDPYTSMESYRINKQQHNVIWIEPRPRWNAKAVHLFICFKWRQPLQLKKFLNTSRWAKSRNIHYYEISIQLKWLIYVIQVMNV